VLPIACSSSEEVREEPLTDAENAAVAAPELAAFLGDGYNMLSGEPVGHCVQNVSVMRRLGEGDVTSGYFTAYDKYQLEQGLSQNTEASVGGGYGGFSANASFSRKIASNTVMDRNSVTMVARMRYESAPAFVQQAALSADAAELARANPLGFEERCGDGFVEKVLLGEELVLVYQLRSEKFSNFSQADIRAAASAKFAEFINAKVEYSVNASAKEVVESATEDGFLYSTLVTDVLRVTNPAEFAKAQDAWAKELYRKQREEGLESLHVLARSYAPYSKLEATAPVPELDQFALMLRDWRVLASRLNYIMSSSPNTKLARESEAQLKEVELQIAYCTERAESCRFPNVAEQTTLEKSWAEFVSLPLYSLVSTPKPYHFDVISSPDALPGYVTALNASANAKLYKTSFSLERKQGYLPQTQLEGAIPLFRLEHSRGYNAFYSTDEDEITRLRVNQGWVVPVAGPIAGYVFESPKYGSKALWRTTCVLKFDVDQAYCNANYPETGICSAGTSKVTVTDVSHVVADTAPPRSSWPTSLLPAAATDGRMTCESTRLGYVLTTVEPSAMECAPGMSTCSGRCVDLTSDPVNCGACGTVCSAGQFCSNGVCGRLVDGAACTANAECASGACNTFYADKDGDGYGVTSDAVKRCGKSVPLGYQAVAGDCCDLADASVRTLSQRIRPGQAEYFDAPANLCGITWDYNCSGTGELRDPTTFACGMASGGWQSSVPGCGQSGSFGGASCSQYGTWSGTTKTQACH
jgi:hypothetical protein